LQPIEAELRGLCSRSGGLSARQLRADWRAARRACAGVHSQSRRQAGRGDDNFRRVGSVVMRAIALLLAFLVGLAWGRTSLPAPKTLSLAPAELVACEGTTVSVDVQAILPTHLDYSASQATADVDLQLRIGPIAVGSGKYVIGGTLTAAVPPLL